MQTTTLLNGLLTKGFTNKPGDIAKLQQSDLIIRDIFDLVQQNKTKKFVLINKILYRKVNEEFFILVVPEVLGKEIIIQCHSKMGFHFSKHQMMALIKPLIFHPRLEEIISHVVKSCLICTISQPKRIKL